MKKKIFLICSILALVLCCGLLLNILTPKVKLPDKVVYRNMEIADNVLVSYDTILVQYGNNKLVFDFDDINVSTYDFLVVETTVKFINFHDDSSPKAIGLDGLGDGLENIFSSVDHQYILSSPLFNSLNNISESEFDINTYTYVLDCRSFSNLELTVYTYVNGCFDTSVKLDLSDVSNPMLSSFYFDYNNSSYSVEQYVYADFYDFYIYAFNGDTAFIDAISDTSINLKNCPDSMLYEGN